MSTEIVRIIVEEGKYGTLHWLATGDKIHDSALEIALRHGLNPTRENAWNLLVSRSNAGYEYETVNLVTPIDPQIYHKLRESENEHSNGRESGD